MPRSVERIIHYERLTAPAEHLEVLVEPADAPLADLARRPLEPGLATAPLLDSTVGALRTALRHDVNLAGPAIVTGHQPEFFHAGVFAKNLAAHLLAKQCGGTAVFLTVDSDLPKIARFVLPEITAGGVRRVEVEIPGCDPGLPYAAQPPVPRDQWLQFFARVAALHRGHDESLLGDFARAFIAAAGPDADYCTAFEHGLLATEAALGLHGLRVLRISALCATPAFRAFAAAWLLDAHPCAAHYNAAQAAYRARHRIRARGRPVPPLLVAGDTVETPFWVVRRDEPRRRLFVTRRGTQLELATDQRRLAEMPAAELARVETHLAPWPCERDGWDLRPRALALSAFARLLLADLFIHGIGGAKYDEMTADLVQRWLGVALPPLACVSATLRLPLPHTDVRPADIAAARQRSRDLRCNPQRHVASVPDRLTAQRAELVRRAEELRRRTPRDHLARRTVFREIRRLNEQLLATDPWRPAQYDARVQTLEDQWRTAQIARDRTYFYALHRRAALAALMQRLAQRLGTP